MTVEVRTEGSDWIPFKTLEHSDSMVQWEDWQVFLEDLDPQQGQGPIELRASLRVVIPAPPKKAKKPREKAMEKWHKSYPITALRAGAIEKANAERRRNFTPGEIHQLPDGELEVTCSWTGNQADLVKGIELEAVVVSASNIDIAPGIGVSPGTVVATTNGLSISLRRETPPGNSLFTYVWQDFSSPESHFAPGDLFAVDLNNPAGPTVVLNSAVPGFQAVLYSRQSPLSGAARLNDPKERVEDALILMIAESIVPSIAVRIIEVVKESVEDELTEGLLDEIDFSEVIELLGPNFLAVARAWTNWLSPSGLNRGLTECAREITETYVSKGNEAFHRFLHDELPRRVRAGLGAESMMEKLLEDAIGARPAHDEQEDGFE
jgi:hypothetical protein